MPAVYTNLFTELLANVIVAQNSSLLGKLKVNKPQVS